MHSNRRQLFISIAIIAWFVLAGCRFPWPAQPRTVETPLSPVSVKTYKSATTAYQKGDYALAAERFLSIRESTSDRRLARMALFGLACARFMSADTPESYIQALELWESWNDNAPEVTTAEDARLMGPLVREKMLFSNIPPKDHTADESVAPPEEQHWLFIRTKQEMDRLRDQLRLAKEADLKHLKKIRSLEKEIATLKRQIIALEAIDQKIQEKKTAIPSAD